MKRRFTKLAVFLLLGAIVNVGVAWGCALFSPELNVIESHAESIQANGRKLFDLTETDLTDDTAEFVLRLAGVGYERARIDGQVTIPGHPAHTLYVLHVSRCGWPLHSLSYALEVILASQHEQAPPLERTYWAWRVFEGPPGPPPIRETRWHVPLRPIWPGFAINTVLFAAILWLPFAPFQLRRYLRVKRGHCIKCGYDLRGTEHELCPECGEKTKAIR